MILFVNPGPNWRKYLIGTFVHEYNHAVAFQYQKWSTLINRMVIEGMAELFLEELVSRPLYQVGLTISRQQSYRYLRKLLPKLKSVSQKTYDDVFYRNEHYPLWTGYSIGYWIVRAYRRIHPDMTWGELVKIKPTDMLREVKKSEADIKSAS